MNNLQELIDKQRNIGEELERLKINYSKDSNSRKTVEYVEKRLEKAISLWEEFVTIHEIIKEFNQQQDIPYFKNNYYNVIKLIHDDIVPTLKTKLESLKIIIPNMNKAIEQPKASTSALSPPKESPPRPPVHHINRNEDSMIQRKLQIKVNAVRRFINKIDLEMSNYNVNQAKQRGITLQNYWNSYNESYEEMMINCDDVTEAEDTFCELEDDYMEIMANLESITQKQTTENISNIVNIETMPLKLKPICIPNFNGNYQQWPTFRDLFTTLIHNNKLLSNVQKIQYLKTNLTGDPAKIINHLVISDQNYEAAWQLLINRYDNKRLITAAHLDTLLSQPIIHQESAKQLKNLHDTTKECVHALKDINIDTIILHILIKKLDKESHRLYEQSIKNPRESQTLEDFFTFLEHRFQTLEAITKDGFKEKLINNQPVKQNVKIFNTSAKPVCILCKEGHKINNCKKYLDMSIADRNNEIRKNNICRNCLNSTHTTLNCRSKYRCSTCKGLHHSSLHYNKEVNNAIAHVSTKSNTDDNQPTQNAEIHSHMAVNESITYGVLLATAVVRVIDKNGHHEILRALIDQGSQATFISEKAAQKLCLPRNKTNITVGGIGSSNAIISYSNMQIVVKAFHPSSFAITTTALVLRKLTTLIPDEIFNAEWPHLKNLVLADENYNKPGKIDLILGADIFGEIILSGIKKGQSGAPIAQETEFGWILSGKTQKITKPNASSTLSLITQVNIDEQLKKFWEIEDMPTEAELSEEDKKCEVHFKNTYSRNSDGRYIVALPFKKNCKSLGNSRKTALSQLFQLERRFSKNKELKDQYIQFMEEYISMGHMSKSYTTTTDENSYYLPHHAVMKDSTTTKLRVVFDASRKTTTGISLNDNLLVGPRLQEDLINIIIRFRVHKIAFSADIAKMYRQILVREEDLNYQKILWRKSISEPIAEYKLRTVTYGTSSAPYLAIKTLLQHADNEAKNHPNACSIIKRDFYVDDLLSGCETEEEAIQIQKELCYVLKKGGFELRKWISNNINLLKNVPEEHREMQDSLELNFDSSFKTLGLHWHPTADYFGFKVQPELTTKNPSKRTLLSEVSKLFDPLGLLAPVIITAKIMLQKLWLQSLNWDDPLPKEIMENWILFKREIPIINDIKINRWIHVTSKSKLELHGFSDASEAAYAAVVYARIIDEENNIHVNIISSKTRVAPIKQISLPRLELCGAVLLVKLLTTIKTSFAINDIKCYAWTDSEIVLAWLKAQPNRWKTFVANRVSKIQSTIDYSQWGYVSSNDNPADCASRGLRAGQLKQHSLWWHGPHWLHQLSYKKPALNTINNVNLEQRNKTVSFISISNNDELIFKYSSLTKVQRITAYVLRFINNSRVPENQRNKNILSNEELKAALKYWIKQAQSNEYNEEIKSLQNKKEINKNSKLKPLNPFIDENGMLRLGGRLQNSWLHYNRKHPVIIPQNGPLTTLIIDQAHKQTLHGGIQLTLNQIRQQYWIVNGRNAVKAIIHRCVTCFKYKGQSSQQLMGNLPAPRLTITRPFTHTGTDYCGPIDIRMSKGRGIKSYKGYIVIFICLSTKAIHIEAVSDLTAEAFIAALKRFTGRRGHVSHIYSDNGTNYVGANKILSAEIKSNMKIHNSKIMEHFANYGIEWHFIPPASPHFGGLWEAGVKSIKYHLKRTIGEAKLSFEELSTVLTQIEACLNSRPLSPLTNDPEDLNALTPGHFLIGDSLLSLPESNVLEANINHLSRWKLCSKLKQIFWKKWSNEYLARLQQRPKWASKKENVKINDMVLLKDEQLPPSKWPLGRITAIHPGKDDLVRVVTVKIKDKEFKRPITKICVLPIIDNDIQNHNNEQVNQINSLHTMNKHNSVKSTCNKFKMSFWTIILMTLFANTSSQNPIKTTPFTNQPGIYFENLGKVNLINNEWNMIVYFDLKVYYKEFNTLKHSKKQLEIFCEKSLNLGIQNEYCNTIFQQLQHQIQIIEDNNFLLNQNEGIVRRKRMLGLVAGAAIASGVAAFGILQYNNAQRIEKEISKVKLNEQHLLTLLKTQTSVVESTVNIIKRNENQTYQQFMVFSKQLDKLAQLSNNFHKEAEQNEINNILSGISMHTLLLLMGYQNMQNKLLEMVINIHHNKLHPLILTPVQLRNQLKIVQANLPSDIRIPGNGEVNNLTEIYRLLKVNVRVTTQYIIFDIKLPLLHTEDFQIFKLIPVPTSHNNTFIWIEPSSEYLIINLKRDQYYPIEELELKECEFISLRQLYLCKQHQPIYNRSSNHSRCEISLLEHEKKLQASCKIKSKPPANTWIQLHNPNSWIYSLDEEYTLDVICDKHIFNTKLQGSGVVELKPNCLIKQPSMIISAHNIYPTVAFASFVPSINLSQQIIQQREDIKIPSLKIESYDTSKYDKLNEELMKLKVQEKMPYSLNMHDIHHYSLLYLLVIIVIILSILYNCKTKIKVNHSKYVNQ